MKKRFLAILAAALLPSCLFAQFGVVSPLHVNGNQLNDSYGNKVVLHGVMDTPSPYFNKYRWGYSCTDNNISACISYYDKIFGALQNPAKGTYCNIFRLHLEPGWTNDPNKKSTGSDTGEANISRFSATRLQKYLDALYLPIAQKAINHGLYVVIRPPGVCPKDLKVGDAYQNYLKTVWNIVSSNSWVKNNSGIVSLELANEPVHIYNRYGQSSATAMRDYFQPVVDVIRKNGFKGIIWIPGTGYQSQYENYASYPVSDSNFGYAVHVYPGWYGASDTSYDSNAFIYNFQKQVPVVKNKPILVSEIDWSPEKPGAGKYNEFGQWVASNLGSWGTATTSKWGNAWKKVMDHFGNISMTLTSTDDYLDIDNFLKTGQIKAGLEANPEACGQTCFYWYYEYSKKDYAHKSAGTSSSNPNTQPSTGSSTSGNTQGENIIKSWGNGSGFVPSGWTVADNGTQVYVGNKSSGPRIMNFSGDFKNAFYVRTVSADKAGYIEYGNTNGYTLPLVYGEYELSCNVAAWKGAPYMKVEVYDPQNAVLASTIVKANGNANGNMGAYLSGTTRVSLSFYSMIKGNYRVRFTPVADAKGTGGAWVEALVGNVALYFKGNPLALNAVGQVPAGWKIVDAGEQKAAGAAGIGPRIFKFAGGDFSTGLYIRQSDASKAGYAEFGSTWGYGFSLKQGSYVFSYNAVAWSGSPYLKCEVLDESNNVLGSQIIQCTKNVNKNTGANTYGSNSGQVRFTASHTGYYHFRFTPVANSWGGSGSWLEVVVGHLKISKTSASRSRSIDGGWNDGTTGIEQVESAENISGQETRQNSGWYTLQGQRVEHPTKGIYIHNGKKVVLR